MYYYLNILNIDFEKSKYIFDNSYLEVSILKITEISEVKGIRCDSRA